jgi:hypothetical protein
MFLTNTGAMVVLVVLVVTLAVQFIFAVLEVFGLRRSPKHDENWERPITRAEVIELVEQLLDKRLAQQPLPDRLSYKADVPSPN